MGVCGLCEALKSDDAIRGLRISARSEGKGGKSREVPITHELLVRLRTFWKFHRNPE